MSLVVEKATLLMSIQDLGRRGYQRFGLPESGPMDWWAHRAANRLVGNAPDAASVELGYSDAVLRPAQEALLAVCGTGYRLTVNRRPIPLWMAFKARQGDCVALEKVSGGNWAYLAAAGGLDTPQWLGSRSAYPRAGLGKGLAEGDTLPIAAQAAMDWTRAGAQLPMEYRPAYSSHPTLRVIPGPHQDRFQPASLADFWESPFSLSTRSDRMGYCLEGKALAHVRGADILSQGMVLGEIQVPGDGQPIVMMPDHPTTGGYTAIGTVIRPDLPLLAQAPLGEAQIRFAPLGVAPAQALFRQAVEGMDRGVEFQEEAWRRW